MRYYKALMLMAALPLLASAAWAQGQADPNVPALRLLTTIPIKGTAASPATKMFSFDISWFDPATKLYYLADRSNAALDVIDTTTDTLLGQIGGAAFGFSGDTGNTATSGPNGVTVAPNLPCIFATDSISRVVSINSAISFVTPVSSVSTGGKFRADELAFDPKDRLILAINNADTPPFGTLIGVSATCQLTVGTKVTFDTAHGVNATNGAEQPVWEPMTQRFYVSIPEINGPGDGTGPNGGVARITIGGAIETVYPVNFMQPAGLTVGPNGDLLVGSNSVFDTSGKKCTAVVPSPSATGAPATCTGIANPQVAICNPGRGCTDGSLVSVPGVGGGDEVYFNSGDGNYYVTAGNDAVGPVFGVVGSGVNTPPNTLTQLVPTLPPVPASLAFAASLTQALEVPPTGSPATGSATILLDQSASTLGVHVTFSGLTSGTIMAHIHCCLAAPFQTGVNVGVATTVPAFPGFPLGVTSGTYDHVLDLTLASSYNPAFITAEGGTVAGAATALIKGIENGETYLNIHTSNFPGGEIRDFLAAAPAAVVGAHGAGTVHSIAASAANNHVYVPLPANTSYPNCVQGCIAVFGVQ